MEDMTLREDECFISDLGSTTDVETENGTVTLGRYAVIKKHMDKLQVLEVGSDLEHLMQKFDIASDYLGVVNV